MVVSDRELQRLDAANAIMDEIVRRISANQMSPKSNLLLGEDGYEDEQRRVEMARTHGDDKTLDEMLDKYLPTYPHRFSTK